MDRVLIDDLRVLTVIGALAHEREAAQPLRVDLSIGLDLHDAGRSDELDDTVSYGLVAECIADLANESKHVLLERLATDIADRVLGFDRVEEVDVTVTKLRPPIPTNPPSFRTRSTLSRVSSASIVASSASSATTRWSPRTACPNASRLLRISSIWLRSTATWSPGSRTFSFAMPRTYTAVG